MKAFLLICCLMLAANTSFCQTVQATGFTEKVSHLNMLLEQGKTNEADATWSEINKMMMVELSATKQKLSNAPGTGNGREKDRLREVAKQQSELYSGIAHMRSDMVKNRADMNQKLMQFAGTIQ